MNKLRALSLSLIVLLLWIAGVQAQDQDAQANEQQTEQATEDAVLDTELTPEELAAAENDELILDTPETLEETEEERASSRFIPTEQISQDLGVSFPVDI